MSDESTVVADDEPEPSLRELVAEVIREEINTKKAEEAKKIEDRQKVIPVGEEPDSRSEFKSMHKEFSRALGLEEDYDREVHSCRNPLCNNPDHGLATTRYMLAQCAVVAAGWGKKVSQKYLNIAKVTGGLLETTSGVGGYIVPIIYETDLIPLLRAKSVVRNIGTPVFPMRERVHNIPRQSGSGTAYWLAEAVAVTASNQAFQQVTLTAKDLVALSFFSNDLLMDSNPAIDALVRDDLTQIMALAEDKAFLVGGAAVSGSPTGIYRNTSANTYSVQSGSNAIHLTGGASVTLDDLQNAVYQVRLANANFLNCAWIMHPRDAYTLRKLKDANGLPVFRSASDFAMGGNQTVLGVNNGRAPSGNLLGYPVWETTVMPVDDTLVSTNGGSAIIFGDFSEALIGDRMQLEVAATSEATVIDPDGSTAVNLFATNQSAIRTVARLDFQLRHPAAFSVIDTIPAS